MGGETDNAKKCVGVNQSANSETLFLKAWEIIGIYYLFYLSHRLRSVVKIPGLNRAKIDMPHSSCGRINRQKISLRQQGFQKLSTESERVFCELGNAFMLVRHKGKIFLSRVRWYNHSEDKEKCFGCELGRKAEGMFFFFLLPDRVEFCSICSSG